MWVGVVSFATVHVGGLSSDERLDQPFQDVSRSSALLPHAVAGWMQGLGLLGMIATLLAAATSIVVRYRRAESAVRRQLKWIALAGWLIPIAIISSSLDPTSDSSSAFTWLPFVLLMIAIPLSIGVAVLRYRLFDVDRRGLDDRRPRDRDGRAAARLRGVIVVGGVLIGRGSPVTTAAATLAVAVAFRPLRSAVQSRVERAFDPRRWSGEQRVDDFLADLRAGRRRARGGERDAGRRGRRRGPAALLLAARIAVPRRRARRPRP